MDNKSDQSNQKDQKKTRRESFFVTMTDSEYRDMHQQIESFNQNEQATSGGENSEQLTGDQLVALSTKLKNGK